jgi:6-pyruvoyltetrahydropterin/6-carboxytetrahydropterin synthase
MVSNCTVQPIIKYKEIKSMITATKKFEFHSAHYLPDYPGKCVSMHGHTFHLEVTVSGYPHKKTADYASAEYPSMVVDFGIISEIVKEEIINRLDHAMLNTIIQVPTAENIVEWIANHLRPRFGKCLERIRLYETDNSFVDWSRK